MDDSQRRIMNFGSDNASGAHPAVLDAVIRANEGRAVAYGHDPYTERVRGLFAEHFGTDKVYLVPTGTGANISALDAMTRPYHAIFTAKTAHLNMDECGAPQGLTRCQVIAFPSEDGKIRPEQLEERIGDSGIEHRSQPGVISITQSTEYGTIYTPDEIRNLIDYAHSNGLKVHVDGARLSNAAASTGVDLVDACRGADVLSYGGTKNGALAAEAIVFFDESLAEGFKYLRKKAGQLISKMRFISAQFDALLTDDLWRKNASNANEMAAYLADGLRQYDVEITQDVETNAVFARMPCIKELHKQGYEFLEWRPGLARLMTSWDHKTADIDGFLRDMEKLL